MIPHNSTYGKLFLESIANVSMAPPKKRKSSNAGDGQPNILTFFSKTPEPSKNTDGEEGRGTEVGKVRGADEREVRGADGGGSSSKVSSSINIVDAGPTEAEPVEKNTGKHRKSGWDPEWLKIPKYSPWLYQTTHGKFQFVDLTSF